MTPGIMSLSSTEIGHVADVVEQLVAQLGGTAESAQGPIGVGRETLAKLLRRPAAIKIVRPTLALIAKAAGRWTVEQLLDGLVRVKGQDAPLWEQALAQGSETPADLEQRAASTLAGLRLEQQTVAETHLAATTASEELGRALERLRLVRLELAAAKAAVLSARTTAAGTWATEEAAMRVWLADQAAALDALVATRAKLAGAGAAPP